MPSRFLKTNFSSRKRGKVQLRNIFADGLIHFLNQSLRNNLQGSFGLINILIHCYYQPANAGKVV